MGGGGPGGTRVNETVAAAVVAGDEEDDLSGLSTTTGGSVRECGRLLEGLVRSGGPYIAIMAVSSMAEGKNTGDHHTVLQGDMAATRACGQGCG